MTDHGVEASGAAFLPQALLPARSVLGTMRRFTWSTDEAVRYEVAVEILSQQLAAVIGRQTRELTLPAPDQALLRTTGIATSQSTTGREEAKDFKVVGTLDQTRLHSVGRRAVQGQHARRKIMQFELGAH